MWKVKFQVLVFCSFQSNDLCSTTSKLWYSLLRGNFSQSQIHYCIVKYFTSSAVKKEIQLTSRQFWLKASYTGWSTRIQPVRHDEVFYLLGSKAKCWGKWLSTNKLLRPKVKKKKEKKWGTETHHGLTHVVMVVRCQCKRTNCTPVSITSVGEILCKAKTYKLQ